MTFFVGQAVPWPHAPSGFAQVVDLRRKKVRLFYRTAKGKERHALVHAALLCAQQLLFEMENPFNRSAVRKSKTFEV